MTNELVQIAGGATGVTTLDPTQMLSAIRTLLQSDSPPLIDPDLFFLISGAPLLRSDEATTPLSAALVTPPGGGLPVLTVGAAPLPNNQNWTGLTTANQLTILNEVAQVTKGLTIANPNGGTISTDNAQLLATTLDVMAPVDAAWMTSNAPRIQTEITTDSYFSKFAESMAISSSNSTSVAVNTPYGGGEANFNNAQQSSGGSSTVATYSVGTYNVNLAVVSLDPSQIQLAPDFVQALTAAVESDSPPASQFVAVVQTLNQYGWYLPTEITVGGALFTSQASQSSSWAEAQSTTNEFGSSFQASFASIGGSAAYNSANKTGTSSSGSSGSTSLDFTAIGGSAADSNNFSSWSTSMTVPANWSIASYQVLIPSIYPLANMDNLSLLHAINTLIMNQYSSSPELESLQPAINCNAYSLAVSEMLSS